MSSLRCPSCHKRFAVDFAFCPFCGERAEVPMTSEWLYDEPDLIEFADPLSHDERWYRNSTGMVLASAAILYFMGSIFFGELAIDMMTDPFYWGVLLVLVVVTILCVRGTYEAWREEGHSYQTLAVGSLWFVGIITGPLILIGAIIFGWIYIFMMSVKEGKTESRQFLLFVSGFIGLLYVLFVGMALFMIPM